jgi:hypothetical protein
MFPGRMPMFVHPGEFNVGAVTTSPLVGAGTYPSTWFWCNHAVVRSLSAAHGRTLNFLGAFLYVRPDTRAEKELIAHRIALEAKAMGASGAIIASIVTGNAVVDNMMACRALEGAGIKVVYLTHEYNPGNAGPRLPYLVPEADAIVSSGSGEMEIEMGAAERVIGRPKSRSTWTSRPTSHECPRTTRCSLPITAGSSAPSTCWATAGKRFKSTRPFWCRVSATFAPESAHTVKEIDSTAGAFGVKNKSRSRLAALAVYIQREPRAPELREDFQARSRLCLCPQRKTRS